MRWPVSNDCWTITSRRASPRGRDCRRCAILPTRYANYFGDLVKKETGKSAQEYIQLKMIDAAKESLLDPDKTIGQVAGELGFQYPQHFVRFFRRHAGCTPNQYRTRG